MAARPRSPAAKPAAAQPKPKPARAKAPPPDTPMLEWIAATLGLATVLAALGLIGSEALRADTSPPSVAVQQLGVRQIEAGYVVTIRAANMGGGPAAQVRVEGELVTPGSPPQAAEATFDFIPDHSAREGGLFFTTDPRQGALSLRATGFVNP